MLWFLPNSLIVAVSSPSVASSWHVLKSPSQVVSFEGGGYALTQGLDGVSCTVMKISHSHMIRQVTQTDWVAWCIVQMSNVFLLRLFLAQYFSTAGQKKYLNHSRKMLLVAQAFLFERQITGNLGLEYPSEPGRGFAEWYTSQGFNLKSPAALPPSSGIKRSLGD